MSTKKFKIETGMQLLARLIKKPEIGNFYPQLFQTDPKNGDIVELCCDSGLPLLIDIICEVLMANLHEKDVGVIHFNTDGNLNYDLLVNVLRKKILSYYLGKHDMAPGFDVEVTLHDILSNFHILELNDATQLFASIHNLENILMEHSNVSLVIFDTLTAFYWSEQGFKITKMDFYLKNLLHLIQKVTKEYKILCVYTRPHYFNSKKDEDHNDSWFTQTLCFRIQITKCERVYKVHVKANQLDYIKHFKVAGGEIEWK